LIDDRTVNAMTVYNHIFCYINTTSYIDTTKYCNFPKIMLKHTVNFLFLSWLENGLLEKS